jgi:hypothetical protein
MQNYYAVLALLPALFTHVKDFSWTNQLFDFHLTVSDIPCALDSVP